MRGFELDIDFLVHLHHLVIHGWLSKNVAIFVTPIDFNLLFRCNYVWYGMVLVLVLIWYGVIWYSYWYGIDICIDMVLLLLLVFVLEVHYATQFGFYAPGPNFPHIPVWLEETSCNL
jgi:hypothetical protein